MSVPLRAGQKTAFIYTEATKYSWLQNLQSAKAWFKANVDRILDIYGEEHQLHREDLSLGTR
jgi:abelson tyrosine-protein kinase 1